VAAEAELTRALELAPDDPEAGALLGWALLAQDRVDDALLVSQQVLLRHPSFALARVGLGHACLRRGIFGEAIEHLAKAIRDDTDRKATLYATFHLGVVYLKREMYDDAVAFFRRSLALGPNLIEAYHEMGRAQWLAGDRAAALETWRAGARAGKFSAWGGRCEALRAEVEAGGEPVAA
jgi:Flp pilus assembly protein TadD